jgi:hypothetical protein
VGVASRKGNSRTLCTQHERWHTIRICWLAGCGYPCRYRGSRGQPNVIADPEKTPESKPQQNAYNEASQTEILSIRHKKAKFFYMSSLQELNHDQLRGLHCQGKLFSLFD